MRTGLRPVKFTEISKLYFPDLPEISKLYSRIYRFFTGPPARLIYRFSKLSSRIYHFFTGKIQTLFPDFTGKEKKEKKENVCPGAQRHYYAQLNLCRRLRCMDFHNATKKMQHIEANKRRGPPQGGHCPPAFLRTHKQLRPSCIHTHTCYACVTCYVGVRMCHMLRTFLI